MVSFFPRRALRLLSRPARRLRPAMRAKSACCRLPGSGRNPQHRDRGIHAGFLSAADYADRSDGDGCASLLPILIGFQRRSFLDPTTLHGHGCDMEAQELCDQDGIEFGSIRLSVDCPECARQSPCDRDIPSSCAASPRTATHHPDIAPASLPDHRVEDR